MNPQIRTNQCLRLLSNQYRKDFNSVRLNTHNSIQHELAKCKVAYELIADGNTILTEAIFKNGSRADILIPELFIVYEILHSETTKEVLLKKDYYPKELEIRPLLASDVLKNNIFI